MKYFINIGDKRFKELFNYAIMEFTNGCRWDYYFSK